MGVPVLTTPRLAAGLFRCTTISAHASVPLSTRRPRWPVLVWSHGLIGSRNLYSSFAGNLASHGVVVVAPEHRDGSGWVSFVRGNDGQVVDAATVYYDPIPHRREPGVLQRRQAQLRVRLWELGLVFEALRGLDGGREIPNYYPGRTPGFAGRLQLQPGTVTWGGHSFGACTAVQFVKSVFWNSGFREQGYGEQVPDDEDARSYEPLYTPAPESTLAAQVTPQSPVVLHDLFLLPLYGAGSRWLRRRPLPQCLLGRGTEVGVKSDVGQDSREQTDQEKRAQEGNKRTTKPPNPEPNVLVVLSDAFVKAGVVHGTFQALDPIPSPSPSSSSFSSSQTPSSSPHKPTLNPALLMGYVANAGHHAASDAGALLPVLLPGAVNRWLLGDGTPARTLDVLVRGAVSVLKGAGLLPLLREDGGDVDDGAAGSRSRSGSRSRGEDRDGWDGWVPLERPEKPVKKGDRTRAKL